MSDLSGGNQVQPHDEDTSYKSINEIFEMSQETLSRSIFQIRGINSSTNNIRINHTNNFIDLIKYVQIKKVVVDKDNKRIVALQI